jgi:hypothetical protein
MGRGIGQPIDDLQLLDDRAGPAMRDDHRQRIVMVACGFIVNLPGFGLSC